MGECVSCFGRGGGAGFGGGVPEEEGGGRGGQVGGATAQEGGNRGRRGSSAARAGACVFAVSGGCRGGFSFWDIREIGRDIGGRERGRARESEGVPITD